MQSPISYLFLLLSRIGLSLAVYLTISERLLSLDSHSRMVVLLSFVVGLPLLGATVSYAVERHRRNHSCMVAIVVVALLLINVNLHDDLSLALLSLNYLLIASFYALAQMVLQGTLIIDTSPTEKRHFAHNTSLIVGVTLFFVVFFVLKGDNVWCSVIDLRQTSFAFLHNAILALVAILLIAFVRFPFRSPEDKVGLCSTDRFLLVEKLPIVVLSIVIAVLLSFASVLLAFLFIVISNMVMNYKLTKVHCKRSTVFNMTWLAAETTMFLALLFSKI